MNSWLLINIAVFLTVAAITGFIIPQILLIAFRKNLYDDTDPRKIHKGSIPRLGGIAFFPAILLTLMLTYGFVLTYLPVSLYWPMVQSIRALSFIIAAILVLFLVGMADDLIGLKYRGKFAAQIIAAILVIVGGVYTDNLHGFLGITTMPYPVSVVLTALLIVFITNAINLIDGIDGLASGLSSIACAYYGIMFYQAGHMPFALLAFAAMGALVPFFYYNVFGNPAKHKKIFMGDTGAITIGIILSILSIRLCSVTEIADGANPAAIAFAPLLIPGLDVVRVYLRRLKTHRNPFMPDKTHIHHKLLGIGITQRIAMISIVAMSLLAIVTNHWLSVHINISILFIADLLVWIVGNMALTRAILARKRTHPATFSTDIT